MLFQLIFVHRLFASATFRDIARVVVIRRMVLQLCSRTIGLIPLFENFVLLQTVVSAPWVGPGIPSNILPIGVRDPACAH